MRRAGAAAVCVALTIAAIAAPSASAASANIIAGDSGNDVFNPATYSHDAGTLAFMTWNSGGSHNVTASSSGPDGKALFRSATISSGTTAVNGSQYANPGSYPFSCTIHFGMNGTLNVNLGTPAPRPQVVLKFKSRDLQQAVRKSAVRVKATISGGAGEAAKVDLKLGKTKLGSATTATTKVLSIKLTKKGKAALEGKSQATLKATASIDFGSPAKAKGKLS